MQGAPGMIDSFSTYKIDLMVPAASPLLYKVRERFGELLERQGHSW